MNSYLLILFLPLACVDLNPEYTQKLLFPPDDTCVNALAEYERCDWSTVCREDLRATYPDSWEPAKVTYELCYLDNPRCEALEEGCDEL